jgi:DNA-binding response OmpR family regulator
MRILLVEEDALVGVALTKILEANRYTLDRSEDESTALTMISAADYAMILLDLHSSKLDGIRLCQQLRSQGYTKPILLLTAQESDADIVAGFDAGADDYVSKPYAPDVLLSKMKTLLRRSGALMPHPADESSATLTWGLLRLDLNSGRVTLGNQKIALTATEYNLLELLLRHPDRIFSRSAILDQLWGFDDAPTDRAVNTYIKDLRKKLKAGGLAEDCIETIYGMGYRLKPAPQLLSSGSPSSVPPSFVPPSQAAKESAIAQVLAKFQDSFGVQVAVLERASAASLLNQLTPELQQDAQREAHRLAGSLAMFGYPEGSKIARSLENLLLHFSPQERDRLAKLVAALKQEITKTPAQPGIMPSAIVPSHRILVIDDDPLLTDHLQAEAHTWGMQIQVAASLEKARFWLSAGKSDAVLLDLSFPDAETDGLVLLEELTEQSPNLPVMVFTGRTSLTDRLAVSRLGARQFLQKPATPAQIFQAIARMLPKPTALAAKVLIVDDDPAMLIALSSLLIPWGLTVETIAEPQQFWQTLTDTSPDLVLLDLEMPQVSGLELCQVVRQDLEWGDLPILVVTAHSDADSLQQAFAAGADDFITKPVLGPELVTRVLSRIERNRLKKAARNAAPLVN